MQHPKLRHIAAAGAIALIATVPLAACGGPSMSPRPVEAAENEPALPASQAPATSTSSSSRSDTAKPGGVRPPAGPEPVKTKTVRPTTTAPITPQPTSTKPTGTCYGTVQYDLDLQNTVLDLVKSMCFHTGGILRLRGIGPGLVTATPASLVSQSYEAGVVTIRFVRPGTVTVTIPQDDQIYTITVVVVS